jgi:phosphoribosyl-AMP cyclohydrolase
MDNTSLSAQSLPSGWIKHVRWDAKGLVPVIAQEQHTGDVLMFAWMNREALQKTVELGRAVYFSRSRDKLWYKGEESGHVQQVHEIRMDCDSDVILLKVTQLGHEPGIACHTGRHSCFYSVLQDGVWQEVDPVIKNPESIYK